MDLPVIGAHCAVSSCRTLDLLPISCPGCTSTFCRDHSALSAHACPSLERNHNGAETLEDKTSTRDRCAFEGCQKFTLDSVVGDADRAHPEQRVVASCPHCNGAYCAAHRHRQDHNCLSTIRTTKSPSAETVKNPAAHALLQKHFPAVSTSSAPKKTARVSKKSTAVELMKMRHQCVPADLKDRNADVPPSQRVYFKVKLEDTASTKSFWLRKNIVTGRALDLLADRLAVRISDSTPAYLVKLSEDGTLVHLRNDAPLGEQVKDGDSLQLSRGTS